MARTSRKKNGDGPIKWPRQYAAEIYDEPSRETRRAMLSRVPAEYRGLVEDHVRIWFEKRASK